MKPFALIAALLGTLPGWSQAPDTLSQRTDTVVKSLQGVVVNSRKKPIDVQPDKTVLNLDAQPAVAGENALDVLRRSPGVLVDAAENIQLNGKAGVQVLLDGKPTQLSAGDLAQLLKGIPADLIQQIELITNPSARYDAAGNAGIIHIKLKKNPANGFNGNAGGSYVQSRHARQNGSVNLNWRKDGVNLFFNGSGDAGLQHVTAINDRITGAQTFTQRSLEKNHFEGYTLRAGIDYKVNPKSTLGFLWMGNHRNSRMENRSTTLMRAPGSADTVYQTLSMAPFRTQRNAFNLNYGFTEKAWSYSLDADYTGYQSSVYNRIDNDLHNGVGVKLGTQATTNDQQVRIALYSLKGDLSATLSPLLQLEAGGKLMTTRTTNGLWVENATGSVSVTDTGKTNGFRYREAIGAVYGLLKGSQKRWSWQLGLRAEHTTIAGASTDLKGVEVNAPDTAYLHLFPSFFLQYQVASDHQVGLTVNRRIDRPNYQDQNPFIYFLDALNTEQGNAFLKPQFTNNVEVSYTYKYAASFKIGYARTADYVEWLTYAMDKYTVQTPQNAGTRQMLSVSLSAPVPIRKWWNVYLSLTPYYHYYNIRLSGFGREERQRGGSWAFNSYMGHNLELGKGWKGSFGGWFNFQNRATIYVSQPLGSFDLGVQKNLWGDKASFKLRLVDVLNTQQWEQRATTERLSLHTYRKWESQNITVGFTWRFGNLAVKGARERATGGEEASQRIK